MQGIQAISQVGSESTGASGNSNVGTETFLTLLIAQLKSQNPLDPMNPNEFVTQLAQFNSLSQLIEIKQLLQQGGTAEPTPGSGTGTSGTSNSAPGGIG